MWIDHISEHVLALFFPAPAVAKLLKQQLSASDAMASAQTKAMLLVPALLLRGASLCTEREVIPQNLALGHASPNASDRLRLLI